jgi:hypothetical protein
VPSHAWNTWRYHYPQAAFPYDQLIQESARRDRRSPEYEILDTGVFDQDRYWVTEVTYAKSDDATELLLQIQVLHLLFLALWARCSSAWHQVHGSWLHVVTSFRLAWFTRSRGRGGCCSATSGRGPGGGGASVTSGSGRRAGRG